MKESYIEQIYAGWLAKIIGIRYGAPVEGWTYDRIRNLYGDSMDTYPVDYRHFAADDDSNGPWFFLRALEDEGLTEGGRELQPQDVARALLNYAPYEHGFFWWGGYGISTEHTAYLNLRSGIPAPESGSAEVNGKTMAEQIGGQIFVDTWGLVNPGKPKRAAAMARAAASVTHDGDGLNGAAFVAACISAAFEETDIRRIIEIGLSFVEKGSGYEKVILAVMEYHDTHPEKEKWRDCYEFIRQNYGYDRYPGICHIIPNIAVMILALLYGEGDFSGTLEMLNLCGWDTDCNVGNVAAILGVRGGLDGIEEKWRRPVDDLLICSGVLGSLNLQDIPQSASYIARLAYALDGEEIPERWKPALTEGRLFHFRYPGSTHSMKIGTQPGKAADSLRQFSVRNGGGCLEFAAPEIEAGENLYLFHKTYYTPEDFSDSRYDPAFSPILYPGQRVEGSILIPEEAPQVKVSLYVLDLESNTVREGMPVDAVPGHWMRLSFSIPGGDSGLIGEAGFCLRVKGQVREKFDLRGTVGFLRFDGIPDYVFDGTKAVTEVWPGGTHTEIRQCTRLKGNAFVEPDGIHLSCHDFGELYTGDADWKEYQADFRMVPVRGGFHAALIRVGGALHSCGAALLEGGQLALVKNRGEEGGYEIQQICPFEWKPGQEVQIRIQASGDVVAVEAKTDFGARGTLEGMVKTGCRPGGAVGIAVEHGSHLILKSVSVHPISARKTEKG